MMGGEFISMTGERFGKLLVIEKAEKPLHIKSKGTYWLCVCDCGNDIVVRRSGLVSGSTKSCGCIRSNRDSNTTTHNMTNTRFYKIWCNMKERCYSKNHDSYSYYGGRGIFVSESWLSFENFMKDMHDLYVEFEMKNGRDSATLDRVDYDGNYCKENCRWLTIQEQARNRSSNIAVTVDGRHYSTLSELAECYGLSYRTIYSRYKNGKRDLELVEKSQHESVLRKIYVEVHGVEYISLRDLQKDYPHISNSTIQRRYRDGKRGADLVS